MAPEAPQLASLALVLRADRQALFVRHAAGPFAGRWSLPFIGVADVETAEDALARLLRDYLHVQPGTFEFLDTLNLTGHGGERFIANAFTCTGWQGEPRFPARLFDDALWAPPGEAGSLDLLPEVGEWLARVYPGSSSLPVPAAFSGEALLRDLADARGELLAAFEAVPHALRGEPLDGDWSPMTVLAHVAEVEAYYRNEVRRCLAQPGRVWRMFNDDVWKDVHALRPVEDETVLRERMEAVGAETREWVASLTGEVLHAYLDHPERGVVQAGDRLAKIADHYREHASQLRGMVQRAAVATDVPDTGREDRP